MTSDTAVGFWHPRRMVLSFAVRPENEFGQTVLRSTTFSGTHFRSKTLSVCDAKSWHSGWLAPTCHVPWSLLSPFPGLRRPSRCQTIRWDWKWCPWFPVRTSLTNIVKLPGSSVIYIHIDKTDKLKVWFHDFFYPHPSFCSSGDPCAGKAACIRGQFTGAYLTWLKSGIDLGKLQLHSRFHQYSVYIYILYIYLLSLFRRDRSRYKSSGRKVLNQDEPPFLVIRAVGIYVGRQKRWEQSLLRPFLPCLSEWSRIVFEYHCFNIFNSSSTSSEFTDTLSEIWCIPEGAFRDLGVEPMDDPSGISVCLRTWNFLKPSKWLDSEFTVVAVLWTEWHGVATVMQLSGNPFRCWQWTQSPLALNGVHLLAPWMCPELRICETPPYPRCSHRHS